MLTEANLTYIKNRTILATDVTAREVSGRTIVTATYAMFDLEVEFRIGRMGGSDPVNAHPEILDTIADHFNTLSAQHFET